MAVPFCRHLAWSVRACRACHAQRRESRRTTRGGNRLRQASMAARTVRGAPSGPPDAPRRSVGAPYCTSTILGDQHDYDCADATLRTSRTGPLDSSRRTADLGVIRGPPPRGPSLCRHRARHAGVCLTVHFAQLPPSAVPCHGSVAGAVTPRRCCCNGREVSLVLWWPASAPSTPKRG